MLQVVRAIHAVDGCRFPAPTTEGNIDMLLESRGSEFIAGRGRGQKLKLLR